MNVLFIGARFRIDNKLERRVSLSIVVVLLLTASVTRETIGISKRANVIALPGVSVGEIVFRCCHSRH